MKKPAFKMLMPLAAVAAAFLAYTVYKKKTAANHLRFVLRGISADFSNFLSPTFSLSIGVQNASDQNFTIQSIVGELAMNGKELAKVNSFATVQIKSNSETIIKIKVEPNPGAVLTSIISLIQQRQAVAVKLTGVVNAEGFQFPININQTAAGI